MSEELKTLKDIESKGKTHGYRERWISENELKAEAVKWVKVREKQRGKEHSGIMLFSDWIDFFGITEEDLK